MLFFILVSNDISPESLVQGPDIQQGILCCMFIVLFERVFYVLLADNVRKGEIMIIV